MIGEGAAAGHPGADWNRKTHRESCMSELKLSRRGVLQSAAALASLAAFGIKAEDVLAADEGVLKVRMAQDIQILDPGYMIGGAETTLCYTCMPRLAVPVKDANGSWG